MATLPVPRSQIQILSEQIETFLSMFGARGLKPGSPILSILESASMSDARDTQDLFDLLRAIELATATGTALDQIGDSEDLPRQQETASLGLVTISDSRFPKIETKVYQGLGAPLAGSTMIYVTDASDFTTTGQIYIGKGTSNLEGPLSYSAPTPLPSSVNPAYWSLTIAGGTTKYHNLAESVILAQGGDRVIAAGQVVGTPQGNAQDAVTFSTTQNETFLDGENELESVSVVCQQTGTIGNVPANTIIVVTSPAFTGMGVTNPLPFSNAMAKEDDDTYRDRIKAVRQSRSKGTRLAIKVAAEGLSAPDESGRITSASLVSTPGSPSILYIDDGTGYEEKTAGVSIESILDEAIGGEDRFELVKGQPVSKASVVSTVSSPYTLAAGAVLAVMVNGVRNEHSFQVTEFRDVNNATAYEVVASINQDPAMDFGARTAESGTKVVLYAKAEVEDSLSVVSPLVATVDANDELMFPIGQVDTLKLFKNDIPLTRGTDYILDRSTGVLKLDTPLTAGDELAAGSIFTRAYIESSAIGSVVLASTAYMWFVVDGGATIISNTLTAAAGISVDLLVSDVSPIQRLTASLAGNPYAAFSNVQIGDWMIIWDPAFVTDSGRFKNEMWRISNVGPDTSWVEFDTPPLAAAATYTLSGFVAGGVTFVRSSTPPQRVALAANTYLAGDLEAELDSQLVGAEASINKTTHVRASTLTWDQGDFALVAADTAAQGFGLPISSEDNVAAHVAQVESGNSEVGTPGFNFTNTSAVPDAFALAGVSSFTLNSDTVTGAGTAYLTEVAVGDWVKPNGTTVWYEVLTVADNVTLTIKGEYGSANLAAASSRNRGVITPQQALSTIGGTSNSQISFARILPAASFLNRYGPNTGIYSTIGTISGGTWALRNRLRIPTPETGAPPAEFTGDRVFAAATYQLGPEDDLNVVLDQDEISKNFNLQLYRRLIADAGVAYSTTIRLKDQQNLDGGGLPQALSATFGTTYDFGDYALYMRARYILDKGTAGKELLVRFGRYGAEGNNATIAYGKPLGDDTDISVTGTASTTYDVQIHLAGGTAYAIPTLTAAQKFVVTVTDGPAARSSYLAYACGYPVSAMVRAAGVVTATVTLPAASGQTDHKYSIGDVIYITNGDVDFPGGFKTITTVGIPAATDFTYAEAGAAPGVFAGPATVSWNANVIDFAAICAVGDYVNVSSLTSAPTSPVNTQGINRITSRGNMFFIAQGDNRTATATSTYWSPNSVDGIKIFPVDLKTVTQISAAVNLLTNDVISTVVTQTGVTQITQSTADDYYQVGGSTSFALADGINYISSATYNGGAGNYDIILKNAVAANLSAPNDYANELFRLAPQTASNISDYLSVGTITGLTLGGGTVSRSSNGGKLQIYSQTIGSGGAVEVQGGRANAVAAAIKSGGVDAGSVMTTMVSAANADGFFGDQWVSIDNTNKLPKQLNWTAATTVTIAPSTGRVTLGAAGTAWAYAGSMTAPVAGGNWFIEKHGPFVAYIIANNDRSAPTASFTTVKEGDFVQIHVPNGMWSISDNLNTARSVNGTAVALNDGTVLVVGGTTAASTAVEVYDPVTDVWTSITGTDPLPAARKDHSAVKLADGRVLVSGGRDGGAVVQQEAWLYDPTAALGARWSATGSLNGQRYWHTTTLLDDGTVLAAGGFDAATLDTLEIYDPDLGTWTLLGNTLTVVRHSHTATKMGNGAVSIACGLGPASLNSAEFYTPTTQICTATPAPGSARSGHRAALLPTGKVLIIGGSTGAAALATCRLYDPVTNTWAAAASLQVARFVATAVALPSGKVLVFGGASTIVNPWDTPLTTAELYDSASDSWTYTGGMQTGRVSAMGVVTAAGKAMAIGGVIPTNIDTTSVETFDPAAGILAANAGLFRVVRVVYDTPNKKWGFWIENPNAIEEKKGIASLHFFDAHSLLPGDQLSIGTSVLGAQNQGIWTISEIDLTSTVGFFLTGIPQTATAVALGAANLPLINGIPATASRLIKQIKYLGPHTDNTDYTDVAFTTDHHPEFVSVTGGSIMNALNKLDFPTDIAIGVDSYRYSTGLIAEAVKVLYGDEGDPSNYPGVVADGASLLVAPPAIRRVSVSLTIRLKSGDFATAKARVQSLVADVVNKTGVGKSIAISDIVAAAGKAEGVSSVAVVYPTYQSGADLIAVYPHEKPMVLDLESDILVSQVGV